MKKNDYTFCRKKILYVCLSRESESGFDVTEFNVTLSICKKHCTNTKNVTAASSFGHVATVPHLFSGPTHFLAVKWEYT